MCCLIWWQSNTFRLTSSDTHKHLSSWQLFYLNCFPEILSYQTVMFFLSLSLSLCGFLSFKLSFFLSCMHTHRNVITFFPFLEIELIVARLYKAIQYVYGKESSLALKECAFHFLKIIIIYFIFIGKGGLRYEAECLKSHYPWYNHCKTFHQLVYCFLWNGDKKNKIKCSVQ